MIKTMTIPNHFSPVTEIAFVAHGNGLEEGGNNAETLLQIAMQLFDAVLNLVSGRRYFELAIGLRKYVPGSTEVVYRLDSQLHVEEGLTAGLATKTIQSNQALVAA